MYNLQHRLPVKRFKQSFFILLITLFSSISAFAGPFTLVIDAGHGGKDAGAVGTVAKEKNINLNVALAFGKLVEQNCPGVKVIYTRKTDVFVSLEERANIANRNKADLFISIHTNAVASNKGSVYGAETYTLGMHRAADNLEVAKRENSVITMESDYKTKYQGFDPNKAESYIIFEFMQDKNMAQSVKLAKAIQQQYASAGRKNKGVHQAGFLVLRETSMPSVLTELGFISNPNEESFLNSNDGVSKLARSIYDGFRNYRRQLTAEAESEEETTPALEQVAPVAPEPLLAEVVPVQGAASDDHFNEGATPSIRPLAATPYPTATKAEEPKKAENSKKEIAPKKAEAPKKEAEPKKVEEQKKVEEPKKQEEPKKVEEPKKAEEPAPSVPEFRIQLLTSDRELKAGDARLNGLPAEYYKDGNTYKYTYGKSTNYNEIVNLKKTISDKFHGIFIIALLDGKRIDLQDAIRQTTK